MLATFGLLACGQTNTRSDSATDEPPRSDSANASDGDTTTPTPSRLVGPPRTKDSPDILAPRFSWKPPFAVPVRDAALKGGNQSIADFWLDVCNVDDKTISVAFRNYRFVEFNGVAAAESPVAASLKMAETFAAAVPKLLVSVSGAYSGVEAPDEMLRRMARAFPKEKFEEVREILKRPEGNAVFQNAMGKYWQTWAGAWLAFDPKNGLSQSTFQEVPGASSRLKTDTTFSWDSSPGYARIRQTTNANDDVAKAMMAGAVAALGTSNMPTQDFDASVEVTMETVTRWPDVRPRWAMNANISTISINGKSQTQEERHHYTFDWERSSPALAKCD